MARLVVFTDANVLYGSTLRDLLLQLGVDKILSLRWTEAVHAEWAEALVRARPDLADRVERTRRIMVAALPEAMVGGYEHFPAEAMPAEVSAIHPDTLLSLLVAADPPPVLAAARKVRHRMAKPQMTPAQYLEALLRAHLPLTARALEPFQNQI
jgi:hypothetical protein